MGETREPGLLALLFGVTTLVFSGACGGDDVRCGPGTRLADGVCVCESPSATRSTEAENTEAERVEPPTEDSLVEAFGEHLLRTCINTMTWELCESRQTSSTYLFGLEQVDARTFEKTGRDYRRRPMTTTVRVQSAHVEPGDTDAHPFLGRVEWEIDWSNSGTQAGDSEFEFAARSQQWRFKR